MTVKCRIWAQVYLFFICWYIKHLRQSCSLPSSFHSAHQKFKTLSLPPLPRRASASCRALCPFCCTHWQPVAFLGPPYPALVLAFCRLGVQKIGSETSLTRLKHKHQPAVSFDSHCFVRQWLLRVALMILASLERRIWGTVNPEREPVQSACHGPSYTALELHVIRMMD